MTRKRTTENELVVSGGAASAARRKASRPRSLHSAPAEPVSAAALETVPTTPSETTSSVTAAEPSVTAVQPSHDAVASLAYSYWEERGYQGGSPEEDWLRAELQIRRLPIAVL